MQQCNHRMLLIVYVAIHYENSLNLTRHHYETLAICCPICCFSSLGWHIHLILTATNLQLLWLLYGLRPSNEFMWWHVSSDNSDNKCSVSRCPVKHEVFLMHLYVYSFILFWRCQYASWFQFNMNWEKTILNAWLCNCWWPSYCSVI